MSTAFPFVLSEEEPVARIEHFDPAHLPLLSHLAMRETPTSTYDYAQQKMVTTTETQQVLVFARSATSRPSSRRWARRSRWRSGAPWSLSSTAARWPSSARASTRCIVTLYVASRAVSAFLRAIPELVSVLFLCLAFGFGPIAGVLALGLHSTGFLGKFYADDVENADPGPQEALTSPGPAGVRVRLWFAVLPQVLPQYIAYTQYILERNVRMATVIGVVGAGGIGVELKGRFDTFDFGHVSTILAVIFATILALERASQWVRSKLL